MAHDTTNARSDALARATALANRARDLRRAQSEVQELTTREVQVLARAAASFFDTIPLPEFTSTLMPQSARGLRRIRHRVLHRTIHNTDLGTLIRALLLGRDGMLRLFSARSADSRDLLLILEPGRSLPVGVVRDVVDWTPMLRVPGFRPFEILDRLSHSLDAVEEQLGEAEKRVLVQKTALTSGDLSALLVVPPVPPQPPVIADRSVKATLASAAEQVPLEGVAPARPPAAHDPFGVFELVEAVANAAPTSSAASVLADTAVAAEPDEWDEPVEPGAGAARTKAHSPATRLR